MRDLREIINRAASEDSRHLRSGKALKETTDLDKPCRAVMIQSSESFYHSADVLTPFERPKGQ